MFSNMADCAILNFKIQRVSLDSDRIFLTAVQLDFIALIIMVKLSITLQVQEIKTKEARRP